jgi:hypothetical protein
VLAVALAALVLAGCTGYSGSLSHEVAQWDNGASLSSNDGQITSDLQDIATGIKERKLVATHTACDGLGSDAGTAYGELPTPDTALTNDLNTAYIDFTNAAQDCSEAPSFSASDFARYRRQLAKADAAFAAAKRRLRSLGDG